MIQYFPKIDYNFNGITQTVTNIFKSVELTIDDTSTLKSSRKLPGERLDQFSSRVYGTGNSNNFWSVLLLNNIKNPLVDWDRRYINENRIDNIDVTDGQVFQFANNSMFMSGNTYSFTDVSINSYNGVNLTGIEIGDNVRYETGTGPYSVMCFGAGEIEHNTNDDCIDPQHRQSIIPQKFSESMNITQTSCGDKYTVCLSSDGYVHIWGYLEDAHLYNNDFKIIEENYWKSILDDYSYIHAGGNTLILVKSGKSYCYGNCVAFNSYGVGGYTDIAKITWVSGGGNTYGGVSINTDNTTRHYGFTVLGGMTNSFSSIACGYDFCGGIKSSDKTAVVWRPDNNLTFCTSNVISGARNMSGYTFDYIAAGKSHIVFSGINGVTAWGGNTYGQCNVSNFPLSNGIVSAGNSHTAVVYSNKIKFSGKLSVYNQTAGCTGIQEDVSLTGFEKLGEFSKLSSGADHLIAQQSGNKETYSGIVYNIDNLYKRIFVQSYSFPDNYKGLFLNNPSGTVVSIWRFQDGVWTEIKHINNKLLTIQPYIDSTVYLISSGLIMDITDTITWNIFLGSHQHTNTDLRLITVKRQNEIISLGQQKQNIQSITEYDKIKYISVMNYASLNSIIKSNISTIDHLKINTSDII